MQYFVSGIGTEVGKTFVSAFLCKALGADYWKPVQAGELQSSDALKVQQLSSLSPANIHPERFRLNTAASPHFAAREDGLSINVSDFKLPATDKPLIVEGAGGLLVPLNERETTLDLMVHLGLPIILVARNYLGSINHTLLSIEILKQRDLPLAGIIYSGENYRDNIEIISRLSGVLPLVQLPEVKEVAAADINELDRVYGDLVRGALIS